MSAQIATVGNVAMVARRAVRVIGVAGAALIALGVVVAPGALAQELSRTTTVRADGPGYVGLHLAEPIEFRGEHVDPPELRFRFSHGGRFAVAVLRAARPDAQGERAMVTSANVNHGKEVITHALERRLPAGDYRLYLVFDGGPAEVTMEAADHEGALSLRAMERVEATVAPVPFLGRNSGVARYGRAFSNRGFSLLMWDLVYDFGGGPGRKEICIYDDQPPASNAYGVGCPGGFNSRADAGNFNTGSVSSGEAYMYQSVAGIGGNFSAADGSAPRVDFVGAWLPVALWDRAAMAGQEQPAQAHSPTAIPQITVARYGAYRARSVRLRLGCTGAKQSCSGRVRLPGAKPRTVTVPAGGRRRITLPLAKPTSSIRVIVTTSGLRRTYRVRLRRGG